MTERSATHATFVIERTYDASPARVFAAFATSEAKTKWFGGPAEWGPGKHSLDFRVGGHEHSAVGPAGGPVHIYDAVFYDILPDERIVAAYEMYFDETRISVSIQTIELKPAGKGTRLTLTEQGVFLDGFDGADGREEGTIGLMEKLGAALASGAI
jgi:uncharacterized protein YndB with AHSA1/START domain